MLRIRRGGRAFYFCDRYPRCCAGRVKIVSETLKNEKFCKILEATSPQPKELRTCHLTRWVPGTKPSGETFHRINTQCLHLPVTTMIPLVAYKFKGRLCGGRIFLGKKTCIAMYILMVSFLCGRLLVRKKKKQQQQ